MIGYDKHKKDVNFFIFKDRELIQEWKKTSIAIIKS